MELKPQDIQEILRIFADSDLEELQLDVGGTRLHVSKSAGGGLSLPNPGPAAPPPARAVSEPSAAAPEEESAAPDAVARELPAPSPALEVERTLANEALFELHSPLLGVFYRRPSPDQPPFVEVGSEVEAEDAVCIIDVMKMFTRVPAGIRGRIVEICIEDGQLVEHGQVLMRIEPS